MELIDDGVGQIELVLLLVRVRERRKCRRMRRLERSSGWFLCGRQRTITATIRMRMIMMMVMAIAISPAETWQQFEYIVPRIYWGRSWNNKNREETGSLPSKTRLSEDRLITSRIHSGSYKEAPMEWRRYPLSCFFSDSFSLSVATWSEGRRNECERRFKWKKLIPSQE